MTNLQQRWASAIAAGLLVLFSFMAHGLGVLFIAAGISLIGLAEFYLLSGVSLRWPASWAAFLGAVLLWAAWTAFIAFDQSLLWCGAALLLVFPLISLSLLFSHTNGLVQEEPAPTGGHAAGAGIGQSTDQPEPSYAQVHAFQFLADYLLGIVYVVLPLGLLFQLAYVDVPAGASHNFQLPMGLMFLMWCADTFAFFAGRKFGKRLIFKQVSPKKTWEGFAAGLVSTVLLGLFLDTVWTQPHAQWWVLGVLVASFGMLGDLVESMLKRGARVKDSGRFLPGHGGLLDRFDGLLFALPFVALYVEAARHLAAG